MHSLDLSRLEAHLVTKTIGKSACKNELWEEIASTNTRCMQLAAEGAPEGVIVMARQQSAGRGRLGRVWHSPKDSGIYASFLLRPEASKITELTAVTLGAGVAAANAVERTTGIQIGLKWVNDLILNGKKLGGILAEMATHAGQCSLVIGIGINVHFQEEAVPDEIKNKMEWLEHCSAAPVDMNFLLAELANQLEPIYEGLLANRAEHIINQWRHKSVTLGNSVIASSGNRQIEGLATDVTESGALVVIKENGERTEIHAGEVTVRTKDGGYC